MTTPKLTVPRLKVSRSYHKLSTPDLHSFAKGTKFTADPLATSPAVNDATIYADADAMLATHNNRQTHPSKDQTSNENLERQTLLLALDKNAAYLEGVANDAALAAGNAEAGKAVITRIGFFVAGKRGGKKHFGIVKTGPGWAEAREPKTVKGVEGHMWRYGTTTAKNVAPTVTKDRFTFEADVFFNNIASGSVFAYSHAPVLPVPKKKKGSGPSVPPASSTQKSTGSIPLGSGKHPVIDFANDNPFTFGDWHYAVIP